MQRLGTAVLAGLAMTAPVAAQDRTIADYDREVGVKYAILHEFGEDGFEGYTAGFGLLFEGGFRICTLGSWNCQAVVEYAFHNFGDADVTYNQLGGGIRFYRLFTPRVRGFGQFVLAWQNDGYEESNSAVVYQPGGGINIGLTRMLDAQVQVDLPFADYDGGVFNQFRIGFGIGIPLGNR
jgi:hypothetical protein